jgi:predicted AAA+ superfamily ATPase
MGFFLPSYHKSVRKQQIEASRFYFFDIGVVRALKLQINSNIVPKTYDYGKLFESFIINEIHKLNRYYESDFKLFYLKTKDGVEVDLIVETSEKTFLIEIKSKEVNDIIDVKPLEAISKLIKNSEGLVLCSNNKAVQLSPKIKAVNWQEGISQIFPEVKLKVV